MNLSFCSIKKDKREINLLENNLLEKENKFSTFGHGGDKRETNKREEEEDIVRQHQKKNTAE